VTVLLCPGRSTRTHDQFLSDFSSLSEKKILTLDLGSGDLPYASGSNSLIFCSTERYQLELHKFLIVPPSHIYVKSMWEKTFDNGLNWQARCNWLASYNNFSRPKKIDTWEDIARYYCILSMSSFNIYFDKWKLIGEHNPLTPDYEAIKSWSNQHKNKTIKYRKRDIYDFPTSELNDNSIIYFHIPSQFSYYGFGYSWTKKRFKHFLKDLTELAQMGYKICISSIYEKWGRKMSELTDQFDNNLFLPYYYSYEEVKANRYPSVTEVYLVANLEPNI